MSRIGRMPVEIPAGVTVTVNGNTVTVNRYCYTSGNFDRHSTNS